MQYRHGDVMIERIDEMPDASRLTALPHLTLAYGEVTGHSHRLAPGSDATLYQSPVTLILDVRGEFASLIHEEHHTIDLPRGIYRAWRQREYTPTEIRTIAD